MYCSNGGNFIKRYILNDRIRAKEVRLIDSDGSQVGIVPVSEARIMSQNQNLDLLLVTEDTNPPVCKIVDFGQFKYEQQKKEKQAKKNSKTQVVKEVKLSPKISDNDFNIRVKMGQKFLSKGYAIKLTVWFKGREAARKDLGKVVIEKYLEAIQEQGEAVGDISYSQRSISQNIKNIAKK